MARGKGVDGECLGLVLRGACFQQVRNPGLVSVGDVEERGRAQRDRGGGGNQQGPRLELGCVVAVCGLFHGACRGPVEESQKKDVKGQTEKEEGVGARGGFGVGQGSLEVGGAIGLRGGRGGKG
uniref:Uncharacterized protein n=1 Tax=Chromera velia CCMP2878 TaxID=1169474 RepID=A0A0G4HYI4_9ALVE|eukprot:Cvel_9501.t1-p1 / transcript=Cvel_9501.t1 / gene=Cvel_9501 / organism=Chromera_velia_CCMP2878 / gene_product=hypothetical protein / transcript_product=hypothetical protein / location=Cvel_scaffold549:29314-29682(-) / protein_length=123 / sequence_SO=supercontig / SO=protein_coding / is_pseudo=false